jgi:hypothetical protein
MSKDARKRVLVRACDLLEGKGWVPFGAFMREVMRVVPFAVAIRYADEVREAGWLTRNKDHPASEPVPPRTRNPTDDRKVQIGQRALVQQALHQACFETRGKIKTPSHQIRLLYVPTPVRMYRRERGRSRGN